MSVVVVDAALVVDLICDLPPAEGFKRHLEEASAVAVPAHLDAEVLSAFGRLARAGKLTRQAERVTLLKSFGAKRMPVGPLLSDAWAITDRISVRDALYVALAHSLDAVLLTTDGRLRRGATALVSVADPSR